MILETERLILRSWMETDVEMVYNCCKEPELGENCGFPVHKSKEDAMYVLRNILMAPLSYAIVERKSNQVIGSISIKLQNESNVAISENEGEIGYWIGKDYWNKGYASEACSRIVQYALDDLEMDCLWAGYFEGNNQSKRVLEKVGFVYQYTNKDV